LLDPGALEERAEGEGGEGTGGLRGEDEGAPQGEEEEEVSMWVDVMGWWEVRCVGN
jgi:hypothetical protein